MTGRYICRICKRAKSKSAMAKGHRTCKACSKDKSRAMREYAMLKAMEEEKSI